MPKTKRQPKKLVHDEEPLPDDSVEEQAPTPHQREPSPSDSFTELTKQKLLKRQRTAPLYLTDEQEEALADWLKSHDFLFIKGRRDYKDVAKKKSLWEQKAKEMGVELKSLNTWYDSVRTRVGKLTTQPSGSCSRTLTDRDDFLLKNFGFLKTQIARMPPRLAVSMKTKAQATVTARESQQTAVPSDSDHDEIDEEEDPSQQPLTSQTETPDVLTKSNVHHTKRFKNNSGRNQGSHKDEETVMATLANQQLENTRLQTHIKSLLTPTQVSSPQIWGSWIGSMAESIHPSLMDQFYQETFQLVQEYTRESARLLVPKSTSRLERQSDIRQASQNMTNITNRKADSVSCNLQPQDQGKDSTSPDMVHRSHGTYPEMWNTPTPTTGLLEARPVPVPDNNDMVATGLQMSGLGSLIGTSQDYNFPPSYAEF